MIGDAGACGAAPVARHRPLVRDADCHRRGRRGAGGGVRVESYGDSRRALLTGWAAIRWVPEVPPRIAECRWSTNSPEVVHASSACRCRCWPWRPRRRRRNSTTSARFRFRRRARAAAQPHFLRGVAILHSFGWKQAIAEFKQAQKLQPDFAMAYWGETLCYNHPLMAEQDSQDPARGACASRRRTRPRGWPRRRRPARKGSCRRSSCCGVTASGETGAVGYMKAMERLYEQFPNDDEVKTFYALSLLSGARALDDNSYRYEMKAGAIALECLQAQSEASRCARITRFTRSTIRSTRRSHSRRRAPTPRSSRRCRTRSTCRRTSSSSMGCGTRWRIRTCALSMSRKEL